MEPYKRRDVYYKPCSARFPKNPPNVNVPPKLQAAFLEDYRVLPLIENKMLEYVNKRHYSLHDNAYLTCRWDEYKGQYEGHEPFRFPDVRDVHFYLQDTRFAPSQSPRLVPLARHRRSLAAGPRVDRVGPVPVAEELHVRQDFGVHKKVNQNTDYGKKHSFLKRKK